MWQSVGQSPAAPHAGGPVVAPPIGKAWCIAKPGVDEKSLKGNLDDACGQGIDCRPIQQGGPCYLPNTMASHAAYAMNAYYQFAGQKSLNCDFAQTGTLTSKDPSMIVKISFPLCMSNSLFCAINSFFENSILLVNQFSA